MKLGALKVELHALRVKLNFAVVTQQGSRNLVERTPDFALMALCLDFFLVGNANHLEGTALTLSKNTAVSRKTCLASMSSLALTPNK